MGFIFKPLSHLSVLGVSFVNNPTFLCCSSLICSGCFCSESPPEAQSALCSLMWLLSPPVKITLGVNPLHPMYLKNNYLAILTDILLMLDDTNLHPRKLLKLSNLKSSSKCPHVFLGPPTILSLFLIGLLKWLKTYISIRSCGLFVSLSFSLTALWKEAESSRAWWKGPLHCASYCSPL